MTRWPALIWKYKNIMKNRDLSVNFQVVSWSKGNHEIMVVMNIHINIHININMYIYIWIPTQYTPEIKQNYTSCFNSISALFLCPRYVCGRCCSGNRWPPGKWVPEPLREEWVAPLRSSAIHGFFRDRWCGTCGMWAFYGISSGIWLRDVFHQR